MDTEFWLQVLFLSISGLSAIWILMISRAERLSNESKKD